ncbi:hypothetical protein E2C01_072169 [Portunus trituberculatus]|uniref:Uncharacterized protein n=1 Tax=Portunus trituberculatus TaxID=210409 RepID=A0A5B7I884_PORTR|nr:hypothetical protein [Portunus trituberculatus]
MRKRPGGGGGGGEDGKEEGSMCGEEGRRALGKDGKGACVPVRLIEKSAKTSHTEWQGKQEEQGKEKEEVNQRNGFSRIQLHDHISTALCK